MPSTASPQTSAAKKLASPAIQTNEQTYSSKCRADDGHDSNSATADKGQTEVVPASAASAAAAATLASGQVRYSHTETPRPVGGNQEHVKEPTQDDGQLCGVDWSSGRRSRDCSGVRTTIAVADSPYQQAKRHLCPSTVNQCQIDNSSRADGCEQQVAGAQVESDSDNNNKLVEFPQWPVIVWLY